eukprot:1141055-Pelagomonas_calceolata.AAC.2
MVQHVHIGRAWFMGGHGCHVHVGRAWFMGGHGCHVHVGRAWFNMYTLCPLPPSWPLTCFNPAHPVQEGMVQYVQFVPIATAMISHMYGADNMKLRLQSTVLSKLHLVAACSEQKQPSAKEYRLQISEAEGFRSKCMTATLAAQPSP